MLDEQSFQDLLSAAFTIQEHNDHLQQPSPPEPEPNTNNLCEHCGTVMSADGSPCPSCSGDKFRTGERLQHKWASMWLMSQEQDLWPEREHSPRNGGATKEAEPKISSANLETAEAKQEDSEAKSDIRQNTIRQATRRQTSPKNKADAIRPAAEAILDKPAEVKATGHPAVDNPAVDNLTTGHPAVGHPTTGHPDFDYPIVNPTNNHSIRPSAAELRSTNDLIRDAVPPQSSIEIEEDRAPLFRPFQFSDSFPADSTPLDSAPLDSVPLGSSLVLEPETDIAIDASADSSADHFADWRSLLHSHRADLYLGAAVLVALFALFTPPPASPQQSTLGVWDRALISLGIAEAAPPAIHLQGDPSINVWVDPHSALYYCPGEDPYGKSPDGRITTQHDAQMDRFEPAGRAVCE